MKPVTQTIFYDPDREAPRGNCWQAALASVLELPIDEVPHFVDLDERGGAEVDWWNDSIQWLHERGYSIHLFDKYPDTDDYVLVSGKSPRGDFYHVVIYKDGKMVHDPHPSGAGIETEEDFEIITKIDG